MCSVLKSQIWWTSDDFDEMWDFGPFAPDSHAATSHVDSVTTCAGSSLKSGSTPTTSGRAARACFKARGPLAEVPDDLRYKTARESVRAKALRG